MSLDKVTVVIKTFMRPSCLVNLVSSIKESYPDLKIMVADDSEVPIKPEGVEYYHLPFDVGLSAGRNYLLKLVQTPYFLLLDDDFFFIDETKIEEFVRILDDNPDIDIIAGIVWGSNYYGDIELNDGVLIRTRKKIKEDEDFCVCTMVPNFFMARTQRVKLLGWDDNLKLQEHSDFLLRAREIPLKIAYTGKVVIGHKHGGNDEYTKYRKRDFAKVFHEKYGIWKVEHFGKVSVLREKQNEQSDSNHQDI